MPNFLKLKGPQQALTTTANAVGGATVLRIAHSSAGNADRVLTLAYANGTTISNTALLAGEIMYLQKNATETLKIDAGADVFVTPVAIS